MRRNVNKKGFTLIELLAVIVILGVIMLIAVPSISTVITNSRKDSFIQTADQYISAVRNMVTSGTVDVSVDPTKATVVSLRAVDLEGKDAVKAQSPFGAVWTTADASTSAYVVVRNSKTAADPKYTYYFAASDAKGNCMALKEEKTGKRADVTTGCSIASITSSSTAITVDSKSLTLDAAHVVLK